MRSEFFSDNQHFNKFEIFQSIQNIHYYIKTTKLNIIYVKEI